MSDANKSKARKKKTVFIVILIIIMVLCRVGGKALKDAERSKRNNVEATEKIADSMTLEEYFTEDELDEMANGFAQDVSDATGLDCKATARIDKNEVQCFAYLDASDDEIRAAGIMEEGYFGYDARSFSNAIYEAERDTGIDGIEYYFMVCNRKGEWIWRALYNDEGQVDIG